MKLRAPVFLVLTLILVSGFTEVNVGTSPFSWPESYSVEVKSNRGGSTMQQIYAVQGRKTVNKVLADAQGHSSDNYTLMDLDTRKIYTVFPAKKSVQESAMTDAMAQAGVSHMFDNDGSWVLEENEMLGNVKAERYAVTFPNTKGTAPYKAHIWLDAATKHPLRYENEQKTVTLEFLDYTTPARYAPLFKIPK